ncbi:MAG: tyrosine-type recombinase/integrase [Candidatus Bathycorpusculaceae bacterium]
MTEELMTEAGLGEGKNSQGGLEVNGRPRIEETSQKQSAYSPKKAQPTTPNCPECGCERVYRDGLRYLADGSSVQRWLCRNCGYRFSNKPLVIAINQWRNLPSSLNLPSASFYTCQGNNELERRGPTARKAAQTLAAVENQSKSGQAGATEKTADIKGKILEYIWHLKKLGRSEGTIKGYRQKLMQMLNEGVNLLDPEAVKEYLTQKNWCEGSKFYASVVYDGFIRFLGLTWQKPDYKPSRKIPFIPTSEELDQLIACTGKNLSALLQLLKETALRVGEALRLKWTDIDTQRNVIILNQPEKGSEPRIFKVSTTLMTKLNQLPKNNEYVFRNRLQQSVGQNFRIQRKRIADKLGNLRLNKITFHTFRHWKATMEYAKTRDILHVMQFLGHKNIKNTLLYTQLIKFEKEDDFYCATAKTSHEAKHLIESGFEYVCTTPENIMLFRKRK